MAGYLNDLSTYSTFIMHGAEVREEVAEGAGRTSATTTSRLKASKTCKEDWV